VDYLQLITPAAASVQCQEEAPQASLPFLKGLESTQIPILV